MKQSEKILVYLILFSILFTACNTKKEKIVTPQFMGYIENTQVNATTRIPGKITAIYVDEGDSVKQGEAVAQLDTRELIANRKAMMAQLQNIVKNKKRLKNLFTAGAVPQQKVDMIETQFDVLTNKINALNIKIEDMTITSPIKGVVNVKVLEAGQMMPPGMPVVIVTDPEGTWARFNVPELYINQINLGDVFNLETNIKNLNLKGKVVKILPMVSFATHTPTTLRGERDVRTFDVKMKIIANQKKCKPGMSVFLKLKPIPTNSSKVN